MSSVILAERHFSTSAFTALLRLRKYINIHQVHPVAAAAALVEIDANFAAADTEAALTLHTLIPTSISFSSTNQFYQFALEILIEHHRPWWRNLFPSGRQRIKSNLSASEYQLFADAKLFEEPATYETIKWWYQIQSKIRAEKNFELSLLGGQGELLTLEYERMRLASLNINLLPEWVGFESNSLGYDIKSYDTGNYEPIVRIIEVKSSQQNPPKIFLTRNEWDSALKFGDSYFFYIWKMPDKILAIKKLCEIAIHIPKDVGEGSWSQLEITFSC